MKKKVGVKVCQRLCDAYNALCIHLAVYSVDFRPQM